MINLVTYQSSILTESQNLTFYFFANVIDGEKVNIHKDSIQMFTVCLKARIQISNLESCLL